jgi:hypothetical protein
MADVDIWLAAGLLLEQYGDGAAPEAAERIDKLTDENDTAGAITWRAILRAIEELKRGRREADPVH